MKKVVGIRFKKAGKVYDFDCGAFVLNRGNRVIVETEQGLGFGIVATPPVPYNERQSDKLLKRVFRLAKETDFIQEKKNYEFEKHAHAYCYKCIQSLGLEMNLFNVETTFDARRLTFFFTAEGRVDFRQLVKLLVKKLGARIEMRQISIRHQTKMCGGLGRCGRAICCSTFMEKFGPVSIRMAKKQNLSLNPTKISGLCGRLMCCLTFENDNYVQLGKKFPKIGATVTTPSGKGKVKKCNLICNKLTVKLSDGSMMEIGLDTIIKEEEEDK